MFDDLFEDDRTPLVCSACGGDARRPGPRHGDESTRYELVACRWCTLGLQSLEQRDAWEAHQSKLRAKRSGTMPKVEQAPSTGLRFKAG